jgi:hypothetical protein
VRVEFCPDDLKDYPFIEKYKLNIDEKSIPDWFEPQRDYVIEYLKDFVSKRIIKSNQKILTGGLFVVTDCIIDRVVSAEIVYLSGTVTKNSGTVTKNYGTVTDNYGTVTKNYGTVTYNYGTVNEIKK